MEDYGWLDKVPSTTQVGASKPEKGIKSAAGSAGAFSSGLLLAYQLLAFFSITLKKLELGSPEKHGGNDAFPQTEVKF